MQSAGLRGPQPPASGGPLFASAHSRGLRRLPPENAPLHSTFFVLTKMNEISNDNFQFEMPILARRLGGMTQFVSRRQTEQNFFISGKCHIFVLANCITTLLLLFLNGSR